MNRGPDECPCHAATVFGILFGATLLGMRLRAALPQHHLSHDAKDAVRVGMGSVATMAALVLGLLVASTKSAYDTEKNEVIQMSARIDYLDHVLANYGPGTKEARDLLRVAVQRAPEPDCHCCAHAVGAVGVRRDLPDSRTGLAF